MKKWIALLATSVALVGLSPVPASAGASSVVIGGSPTFPFTFCAEFGAAPNNWFLTVNLSPTVVVTYGSDAADRSTFKAKRKRGIVKDATNIFATSSGFPAISAKLSASYTNGRTGHVKFSESAPLSVRYRLTAPAHTQTGTCPNI